MPDDDHYHYSAMMEDEDFLDHLEPWDTEDVDDEEDE